MDILIILGLSILALIFLYTINLFFIDHLTPINSLQIKYNADKIRVPNQLNGKNWDVQTEQDKINAEIKNQPLEFNNQIYSFSRYPFVGEKQYCKNDSDCSQITAKCDPFDRDLGVGVCTIRQPDSTVFDIKFQ